MGDDSDLEGDSHQLQYVAVQTSVTDLGIEMQQNGSPFELDKPLSIDPASPPMLKAVPVKASGAVLGDGAFSAYATLQVDYQ